MMCISLNKLPVSYWLQMPVMVYYLRWNYGGLLHMVVFADRRITFVQGNSTCFKLTCLLPTPPLR
jgi:hypothetical protein